MKVTLKVSRFFFDRAVVIRAMDKATRKSLAKAGGFIRSTARRSMRRAKPGDPPSRPGQPPRARAGQVRDLYFFSWDPSTRSVVAGPERFNARRSKGELPTVLLEEGGHVRVYARKSFRGRRRIAAGSLRPTDLITVPLAARPYSSPALKVALERGVIPEAFKNSVRGG